ncbi:hypothetical protein BH11MYX1_BH11MYX1_36440 [soil metagenome]
MKTIIFLGPTLAAAEVRLADGEFRPPAAVGDILALALAKQRPARIALIDGYFERMAAVWHKEILLALERGIAVYGAASMGALRAAELSCFGMTGVGVIYKAFASGELTRDDEVDVAHLPAAQGYRAVSTALVDLRHGLDLAVKARAITATTRARLIELAAARFYRERTWPQLVADARAARLSTSKLEAWLAAAPVPSRKAADARLLLAALARPRQRTRHGAVVPRTWALRQLIASTTSRRPATK